MRKGLFEIFDGRDVWLQDHLPRIQLHENDCVSGSMGVLEAYSFRKEYKLCKNELQVEIGTGRPYDVHPKALDAIFNYIRTQDVYQNAFKILQIRYQGGQAYVGFTAYVANERDCNGN